MPHEEWRPAPGYEGIYSVSSLGRIRRDAGGQGAIAGRIIKPKRTAKGYRYAPFSVKDQKTRPFVHRLVAGAFHGPPPSPQHVVNHKNADKADNRAVNLEWCTIAQNNTHARENNLLPSQVGERNGRAILTAIQVAGIRKSEGSLRQLAAMYGVARTTIQAIRTGRNWSGVGR